jgi:hypothetical protein
VESRYIVLPAPKNLLYSGAAEGCKIYLRDVCIIFGKHLKVMCKMFPKDLQALQKIFDFFIFFHKMFTHKMLINKMFILRMFTKCM